MRATVLSAFRVDLDRRQHLAGLERLALQACDRVPDVGRADVLRLDHDDCRLRAAREGVLHGVDCLHFRRAVRQ